MRCPYCRLDNDRVIDSRGSEEGFAIRRRRECLHCKRRFTTYERIEEIIVKVVKKDGVRSGLAKACWKRPISDEQIDAAVTRVENEIYAHYENEIDSKTLGALAMKQLSTLDQVAFVRFASVYREFKDVRDFVDELQPMLKRQRPEE
jgi:transcriptional repressor NrdR